ncbi:MAG TPA: hypothetical protein DHV05_08910 [Acholeplasmataceae bacterium]|nr:hypothetical protein [Acholeplasmataceae bacterium]
MMKLELSREDLKRTKGEIRYSLRIKKFKEGGDVKLAIDYHIVSTLNTKDKEEKNGVCRNVD